MDLHLLGLGPTRHRDLGTLTVLYNRESSATLSASTLVQVMEWQNKSRVKIRSTEGVVKNTEAAGSESDGPCWS